MGFYFAGSPERAALEIELKRVKSEVVEIPCIVDGKEYFTGLISGDIKGYLLTI